MTQPDSVRPLHDRWVSTQPTPLRKIKKVKFEMEGDWPALRAAVNADIAELRKMYSNYTFSVTFAGNP